MSQPQPIVDGYDCELEAVALPRRRRRRLLEHRGFLAPALIAPAVFFVGLLVGAPLVLSVYLSLTDATAGSLSGDFVGFDNFRQQWTTRSSAPRSGTRSSSRCSRM